MRYTPGEANALRAFLDGLAKNESKALPIYLCGKGILETGATARCLKHGEGGAVCGGEMNKDIYGRGRVR